MVTRSSTLKAWVGFLTAAVLAAAPVQILEAAPNATFTIAVRPGRAVAIQTTPAALSFHLGASDAEWIFRPTARPWFPPGVQAGWVYGPSGQRERISVAVATYLRRWTLRAYAVISEPSASLTAYLAEAEVFVRAARVV